MHERTKHARAHNAYNACVCMSPQGMGWPVVGARGGRKREIKNTPWGPLCTMHTYNAYNTCVHARTSSPHLAPHLAPHQLAPRSHTKHTFPHTIHTHTLQSKAQQLVIVLVLERATSHNEQANTSNNTTNNGGKRGQREGNQKHQSDAHHLVIVLDLERDLGLPKVLPLPAQATGAGRQRA